MLANRSIFQLVISLVIVAIDSKTSSNNTRIVSGSFKSTLIYEREANQRLNGDAQTKYNTQLAHPRVADSPTSYSGPRIRDAGGPGPNVNDQSFNAVGVRANDFNPQLLGGRIGYPGIMIRINPYAFIYLSQIAAQILSRAIAQARIPDITQEISQVNGVITVCNIHVTNFRPPCNVEIFPSPPNMITIRVTDFDVAVAGNLDGMALILLPIPIYGIVHVSLYHVSAMISVAIERAPDGSPYVALCGCQITIGDADVCIEQGGLVGALANIFAREMIVDQLKQMIPDRVCNMLPSILNQRVNPMLHRIPQSISFTQIAAIFSSFLAPKVPPYCFSPACQAVAATMTTALPKQPAPTAPPPPNNPPTLAFESDKEGKVAVSSVEAPLVPESGPVPTSLSATALQSAPPSGMNSAPQPQARAPQPSYPEQQQPAPYSEGKRRKQLFSGNIEKVNMIAQKPQEPLRIRRQSSRQQQFSSKSSQLGIHNTANKISKTELSETEERVVSLRGRKPVKNGILVPAVARGFPTAYGNNAVAVRSGDASAVASAGQCAGCPAGGSGSMAALQYYFLQQLNMNKLSDVVLTTQMLRTYATNYDFNIDLNGEFSPHGLGGTPFGPFPMYWPTPIGRRMIEIMLSDYTINSLLYVMHRRDFITLRVGPETPGVGSLLTTTCDDGSDYSTETGDGGGESILLRLLRLRDRRRQKHHQLRQRRQADGLGSLSDLAGLGICVGDIMPAIKEKYPNQKLIIVIHTARAPSIQLSGSGGGLISLDLMAFADFYLDGTNTRIGTLVINLVAGVAVRIIGNRISGTAAIHTLQLRDRDGTFGLEQDALDNLANLAKGIVATAANQQLQKEMVLNLPTDNLPINIINPEIRIVDHALHIQSDISVPPSLLQSI